MASGARDTQFVLIEKDGYRKEELFKAGSLAELREYISEKGGEHEHR